MGFFFGVVIGIASGVGLMMSFAYQSKIRAKRRSELAATIQAFAKMTVRDSRRIFTSEIYPPWLVFQERQKLDWLNIQLNKIWPYVNEAASELIRSSVEPTLEQYRPAIIDSLKFKKLTLGTVAPQFTGVWFVDGEPGEIIMELEIQWDGNPSIILDIKALVGVALPVQVKNIAFTGVFRLIFKPLQDELPCFGAVCYSLREKYVYPFMEYRNSLILETGEISMLKAKVVFVWRSLSVSPMAPMCRSIRFLSLLLLSLQLCSCFFSPSVQALSSGQSDGYTIAGRVKIPIFGAPGKISKAKVILNGGQKVTFLRPDGYFSFSNVPAGTHLIEVDAIGYFFSPVRVDVSSRNPGKVHAALTETRRGLLELVLEPLREEQYYEIREPFSVMSLVKSPMGLMVGFMLIVVFLMPKLMENMDPEEMKRAQEEMRSQGVPSLANFLSGAGRT